MDDQELRDMFIKYQAEQREDEVIWFYRHVEKIKPGVIVEIGIKEGGNLKVLSSHLDETGIVVGIDVRQEIPWKMDDAKCKVVHIKRNSHDHQAIEDLQGIIGDRPIDVLFIDGDHTKEGMLQDFKDYESLVRSGGIIAVHDIFYLPSVSEAWQEVPGNNRHESERNQSSIGIGFIIKE